MQPMQQKRQKSSSHSTTTALLLLLCYLVATVASVPTSVLAQNSEVTSNIMSLNANKLNLQANKNPLNNNNNNLNLMAKVKRSSNNNAPNNLASSGLDKKSSPEVLPPAFNIPSSSSAANQQQQEEMIQQQQLQQLQHQQPQEMAQNQGQGKTQPITNTVYTLPSNSEIIAAVEAAAAAAALNQRDMEQRQAQYYGSMDDGYDNDAAEFPMQPHKRGIMNGPQYIYDGLANGYGNANVNPNNLYGVNVMPNDYYNPYMTTGAGVGALPTGDVGLVGVPNGYWADDDSGMVYSDMQDMNDFASVARGAANYRSKAYDNLQNILNSEAYLESAAAATPVPVQYAANRYYANLENDHAKRNKFSSRYGDYRLKRDAKLTPADMLALVALVEAGERARQDSEDENRYQQYENNNNKNAYDYYVPVVDDPYEYGNNWYDSAKATNLNTNQNTNNGLDFYGMPMNVDNSPKYENKYANNPYEPKYENVGNKRYMVSKRHRLMGKFLKDPVGKPSVAYNGEKYF